MLVVRCPGCATRYHVPKKLLNQKVSCKKCGQPFRLAAPPPKKELEEDLLGALAQGAAQARPEAGAPATLRAEEVSAAVLPGTEWSSTSPGPVEAVAPTGFAHYLRDVGRSLLFFTHVGDLITFVIVVVLVSLQIVAGFAPCFGLIVVLIIQGWYMAFRLNVVVGAAAGEQNLPNLTLGAPWEGIILPLLKWLMAWIAALVPFIIGLVYLVVLLGQMTVSQALGPLGSALVGDFRSALDDQQGLGWAVGGILLLIPMTLWPMMLLVVAIGGIRCLVRFDLMLVTIVRSFPAYALAAVLAHVSVIGPALLPGHAGPGAGVLSTVLQVYASIFAMRVIGLFYHHFKERFAWSWG